MRLDRKKQRKSGFDRIAIFKLFSSIWNESSARKIERGTARVPETNSCQLPLSRPINHQWAAFDWENSPVEVPSEIMLSIQDISELDKQKKNAPDVSKWRAGPVWMPGAAPSRSTDLSRLQKGHCNALMKGGKSPSSSQPLKFLYRSAEINFSGCCQLEITRFA